MSIIAFRLKILLFEDCHMKCGILHAVTLSLLALLCYVLCEWLMELSGGLPMASALVFTAFDVIIMHAKWYTLQ